MKKKSTGQLFFLWKGLDKECVQLRFFYFLSVSAMSYYNERTLLKKTATFIIIFTKRSVGLDEEPRMSYCFIIHEKNIACSFIEFIWQWWQIACSGHKVVHRDLQW